MWSVEPGETEPTLQYNPISQEKAEIEVGKLEDAGHREVTISPAYTEKDLKKIGY